jgi:WD40 repeat protein
VAKQPATWQTDCRLRVVFILASVQALLVTTGATATTIDVSPYPSLILPGSNRFLVRDAPNGVALYRFSDLGLVHRFRAASEVCRFAATSDGKVLILGCVDGGLSAFDLSTGSRSWELSSSESGLTSIWDIGISYNGQALVVCTRDENCLAVFETSTGRRIATVPLPDGVMAVCAVALAPDGTRGIFLGIGDDERLYTFEVPSGRVTKTSATKLGIMEQAAYSVDGKYVALRPFHEYYGSLAVVTVDGWTVRDVGAPTQIGHLTPTADGGFLLTTLESRPPEQSSKFTGDEVGLRWRSGARDLEELWRLPTNNWNPSIMDFDPEKLIEVFTDFRFVTSVQDLRTAAILGRIDNSANYRARITTSYSPGIFGLVRHWLGWDAESNWTPAFRGAAVLGGVAALWLAIRRRRLGKGTR